MSDKKSKCYLIVFAIVWNIVVSVRIINTVGVEKAFLIFKETKRIEEEGGLLIMVNLYAYFIVKLNFFCRIKQDVGLLVASFFFLSDMILT